MLQPYGCVVLIRSYTRTVDVDPELLERLRSALRDGPALRLAVLFGSTARGQRHAQSDVDIGIIPDDPDLPLKSELDLQCALERVCAGPVDLLRLDRAPIALRWRVAKEGLPIWGTRVAWIRFVGTTASEYADFAPALSQAARLFQARLASGGNR